MLTEDIAIRIETQKTLKVAPSSPNCYTKQRKTDQKSCRVESRTQHPDK